MRSVNTCCNKVDAGPWNLHALLLDPGHLLGVHLPRDVVVPDKDYLLVVSSPFLKKKIVSDVFTKRLFMQSTLALTIEKAAEETHSFSQSSYCNTPPPLPFITVTVFALSSRPSMTVQ